jgi:CheY-like chemotaxis protein
MVLDRHMSHAWVDPDQVQQVLFNLVKNAEQAMTDAHGGGTLTVRTAPAPDALAYGGAGAVRVSIADDGPGVSPEVQRRIFDPFFTTKEAGQGTGLGLTISYSIIDEHNGRIWVENRPEGGAAFTIELPVTEQANHATELHDQPSAPSAASLAAIGDPAPVNGAGVETNRAPISLSGPPERAGSASLTSGPTRANGRSILVVDDEESIRLLLSDVLAVDGHHVDVAASGIEAMEKLLARPYDLIISDIKMPGMDGATLYRELQAIDAASIAVHGAVHAGAVASASPFGGPDSLDVAGAPGAPRPGLARRLIFITGDTVSPDTRAFLGDVTVPVLTKPFRVGLLRETIDEVLAAG